MTVSSNYSSYSAYASSGTSSSDQTRQSGFEEMMASLAQQMMTSMDTDNNGSIDKAEFSAAAQALASQSTSSTSTDSVSSAEEVFALLDTNQDGSMSSDELMSALKNMRPPEPPKGGEMGSMPPPPPSNSSESSSSSGSSDIFSALDTNQDGTVSMEELIAALGDNSKEEKSNSSQSAQSLSNDWLQKILSAYGNNTSSNTASLLSVSA